MSLLRHAPTMLILTGQEAEARALEWRAGRTVWLSYDDANPPLDAIKAPSYQSVALFAEETRFPEKKAKDLWVVDLKSLRNQTPTERHPLPSDVNPQLLHQRCESIVFSSLSRLYNQMLVEIGYREEIEKFVYPLAAEALTHVICTLRDANKRVCMTAHETLIGNRVVPHVPKSVFSMCPLWLKCDGGRVIVLKSTLPGWREGDELKGPLNAL